MLVNLDHLPKVRGEHKKIFETTARGIIPNIFKKDHGNSRKVRMCNPPIPAWTSCQDTYVFHVEVWGEMFSFGHFSVDFFDDSPTPPLPAFLFLQKDPYNGKIYFEFPI